MFVNKECGQLGSCSCAMVWSIARQRFSDSLPQGKLTVHILFGICLLIIDYFSFSMGETAFAEKCKLCLYAVPVNTYS